jgi:DinB superfamily
VVHCADSETNAAARIRYLAAEADPVILGYDEAEWARRFDYHDHPLEPALVLVEAVRANTVALIRRIREEAWQRVGRHSESGRYSAEDWLKIYAEHLEIHARQIEANVAAWREAGKAAT